MVGDMGINLLDQQQPAGSMWHLLKRLHLLCMSRSCGDPAIQTNENQFSRKDKPWKCRGVESMESQKAGFHPSHTPWKSLRGFPHYRGFGDDYHVSEDRQSPPKTRNQSRSHRKGLVNHVPGLKRKGCPGTLSHQSVNAQRCRRVFDQSPTTGLEFERTIYSKQMV